MAAQVIVRALDDGTTLGWDGLKKAMSGRCKNINGGDNPCGAVGTFWHNDVMAVSQFYASTCAEIDRVRSGRRRVDVRRRAGLDLARDRLGGHRGLDVDHVGLRSVVRPQHGQRHVASVQRSAG